MNCRIVKIENEYEIYYVTQYRFLFFWVDFVAHVTDIEPIKFLNIKDAEDFIHEKIFEDQERKIKAKKERIKKLYTKKTVIKTISG
jgi:hypothetical protein